MLRKTIDTKPHPNFPVIPENEFFLERPRIHRLLVKALEGSVLIISAGEGYGKTYAVSSFLKNRSETTIWIQNSERDNQPLRFWENYSRAMGFCKFHAGKELREIGFPETTRQFSKWYEIEIKDFSFPDKYVVVGDDFHRITSKSVLNFINRVLDNPIPSHTLILICRREPVLNITPSLSKGRLTRIGAEELLFTEEEIAGYFRLRNMDLSAEEIAAVHRDTEGWPLSLGIVATEIQKAGGRYTRPILEKGAFRIFEDDLFVSIPKELQNYLLMLSLFEQWPVELLERIAAVLPEQYRQLPLLLVELEKLGAFIRYDYYLHGYRIHQIFLDYLREKQKELSREDIKTVCSIAAQWCLENNLKMDAAFNFERAGNYAALVSIVNSFPRIIPMAAAAPLLDIVTRLSRYEDRNEQDKDYIYLYCVARGRLLMCLDRFEESKAVFEESIRFFEDKPLSPIKSWVLAETLSYLGSMSLIKKHLFPDGFFITCAEQSDYYYRQFPWPLQSTMTVCNVGSYVVQINYPAGAGEFERRVAAFADAAPRIGILMNGFFSGMSDLAHTEFAYFQGDLNAAEQFALKSVIQAREHNQYQIENRALFFLLRIKLHRGGLGELLEVWKEHDSLLSRRDYLQRNVINDINNGWLYTQLGYPSKTASWFQGRIEENDLYSIFYSLEALVKAKYLYAEKRFTELLGFLDQQENKEGLGSYLLGMIEMNCITAAALCQLNEEAAAAAILEITCEAAIPNSLIMPFIELGYDMRPLAAAALNAGSAIPRPWLEDIRNRASAYGKSLFAIAEQYRGREADGTQVYLTKQERMVLKGLSRGQTREEIAAATRQPLSAVKSLISSICVKLGAVNRADAVHIALNLGILEKIE
jgi:LuxR family maltose regulon positive regulatory protein